MKKRLIHGQLTESARSSRGPISDFGLHVDDGQKEHGRGSRDGIEARHMRSSLDEVVRRKGGEASHDAAELNVIVEGTKLALGRPNRLIEAFAASGINGNAELAPLMSAWVSFSWPGNPTRESRDHSMDARRAQRPRDVYARGNHSINTNDSTRPSP